MPAEGWQWRAAAHCLDSSLDAEAASQKSCSTVGPSTEYIAFCCLPLADPKSYRPKVLNPASLTS
jgi:hypothetical protein